MLASKKSLCFLPSPAPGLSPSQYGGSFGSPDTGDLVPSFWVHYRQNVGLQGDFHLCVKKLREAFHMTAVPGVYMNEIFPTTVRSTAPGRITSSYTLPLGATKFFLRRSSVAPPDIVAAGKVKFTLLLFGSSFSSGVNGVASGPVSFAAHQFDGFSNCIFLGPSGYM